MARQSLTTQQIALTGVVPSFSNAHTDGHAFGNRGGRTYLEVKNGSGSSINVTLVTPITVGERAVADDVVAVAAGDTRKIGPFDESTYNNPDGTVWVNLSATTSVTLAAFTL